MRRALIVTFLLLAPSGAGAQGAQAPWRGENLQFFPKDIPRPQLVQRIREFSFALDVRCQHCHAGGDGVSGKYNFGEWEINELARQLTETGKTAEAIAILEMNGEFNPKSADIDFTLGELHRGRKENGKAVARYRSALEKNPQHQGAKRWLSELTKQ